MGGKLQYRDLESESGAFSTKTGISCRHCEELPSILERRVDLPLELQETYPTTKVF